MDHTHNDTDDQTLERLVELRCQLPADKLAYVDETGLIMSDTQMTSQATLRLDGTVYFSELADKGWTRALVRRHVGEPDIPTIRRLSGTVKRAARWSAARIHAAEADPEIAAKLERNLRLRAARSAASVAAMEVRREATIAWAESVPIELAAPTSLERAAILGHRAFLELACDRGWDASRQLVPTDQLTVNWLRHERTVYDDALAAASGNVGVSEARQIIRQRVLGLIAETYPELRGECEIQGLEE